MSDSGPVITNVLAERYASKKMREIWSREEKIMRERKLWIAVMKAQSDAGVKISADQISQYEKVISEVNLDSIDRRERALRHDVKARIEEFNSLAGLELIHLSMTSRDLTENVEMMQVRDSLLLVRAEVVAILGLLGEKIEEHKNRVIVGRSHNVPAQLTTLGKRFATIAEELLFALERLDSLITRLPLRGLRGPVGTAQDLHDLVGDEAGRVESRISNTLGFSRVLDSTGQIYPRSIDFEVISTLVQLSAAPSNLAIMVRLMSGLGLVSEGFKEGQVGSSAMPHKINARSSERINALSAVLKGHLTMMMELSGNQWNEGDVSCSVVRRVALADAFFTIDGIYQTTATILKEFEVFDARVDREIHENLAFVATTGLLMEAVKRGLGREIAHKIIQRHLLESPHLRREGFEDSLISLLGSDPTFPLESSDVRSILDEVRKGPHMAQVHIGAVLKRIKDVFQTVDARSEHLWEDVR